MEERHTFDLPYFHGFKNLYGWNGLIGDLAHRVDVLPNGFPVPSTNLQFVVAVAIGENHESGRMR